MAVYVRLAIAIKRGGLINRIVQKIDSLHLFPFVSFILHLFVHSVLFKEKHR